MSSERLERRRRDVNGLPREEDLSSSWWQRLLANQWSWAVIVLLFVFAIALVSEYFTLQHSLMQEIAQYTEQIGAPTELTATQYAEAVRGSLWAAALTVSVWAIIFLIVDRIRPTSAIMKVLALGWGACIATFISLHVNTWASGLITEGAGDPASSTAGSVYIAPVVEEFSKCTIVILLAIALRYRFCTVFQTITLAGLSGIGFAFTENIIYYTRTFLYAAKITGNDPEASRSQLMLLRGVLTSFGHPLFTTLFALALIVAMRQKSKLVRIITPLGGYALAVTGHMCFNGLASIDSATVMLIIIGWVGVLSIGIWAFRQIKKERAQAAWRLDDYVRMGWLTSEDPLVFSSMKARGKLALAGLLRGWRVFRATTKLQTRMVELAYLRTMTTRGLVDEAGALRERELLIDIRALRTIALDNPEGLRIRPEGWPPKPAFWTNWRASVDAKRAARAAAAAPAPNVPPGYQPAPAGAASGPSWAPPATSGTGPGMR